jgi:glyoxylase-like metal-dependent hydrolase (beta-lactamase superfamily II)
MYIPKIENLQIRKVTEDVLLLHQIKPPSVFSCCDGLLILPKEGRNQNAIILDANIEPELVDEINTLYGPIKHYLCTHGHMDHIAHVHAWEQIGATIHAPSPEATYLIDLYNFYEGYGFNESLGYSTIEKFGKLNKFQNCNKISSFEPGDVLKFEGFEVETIPFTGHSKSHIGLLLKEEKILHVSCLGFDQSKPDMDGFGPWYGFRECSITQYIKDIDMAEMIYRNIEYLTSSHSYIAKNPDMRPFEYMRRKIKENQQKVDIGLMNIKSTPNFEEKVKILLKLDIFFPKKKMRGFLREIYTHWESWIITKHLQQSKLLKY